MGKVFVIDHPLIQHKLTLMRNKKTSSKDFRTMLNEISMLMGYEVTRDLPMKEVETETPIAKAKANILTIYQHSPETTDADFEDLISKLTRYCKELTPTVDTKIMIARRMTQPRPAPLTNKDNKKKDKDKKKK